MTPPVQRYAIWLLPAPPDREALQKQIQSLSARFSTIPFAPHLTLFAGVDTPLATLQATVETICTEVAPFAVLSTGVNIAPHFFQTLFVEFAPHPGLTALAERLRQALDPGSARPFQPHLSLLYHEMSFPEKEVLQAETAWEPHPIWFDAVSIVFPPPGERGWYDLAGWKTMSVQPLRTETTSV